MEVEFSTASPLQLRRALLIYESGSDVAVTEHTVTNGNIQPDGKPLDLAAFARLLSGVSTKSALEWVDSSTLAITSQWLLWWTPPQFKEVFVAKDYEKNMKHGGLRRSWFPGFVWCGHRSRPSLYLWAFAGKQKPTESTVLYRPSYGPEGALDHIFQHTKGSVCLGSSSGGDHTVAGWQRSWWDSLFKTPRNLDSKPYDISKRFTRLGTLASLAADIASGKTAD